MRIGRNLSMPGKGGYRLIGEVRALATDRGGATPAAALTAYVGEPHRTSVLRAGFQCHVEKPVRVAELIDVVSRLATNARSTELDAKSMRGPVVGESNIRSGVENNTIEFH
jgi:DNA-binding response OmpR family regulator